MSTHDVSIGQTASEPMPAPKAGGRLLLLAKLAITLLVLGLLASRADWSGVWERVANADPVWLAAGFLGKLMSVIFAAERWRDAVWAVGTRLSRALTVKLVFAALFLGQLLPGSVGGDMARGWLTYRNGCSSSSVVIALVLDRMLAVIGCVVLLFVGLPHLVATTPPAVAWMAPAMALALAAAITLGLQADHIPLPTILRRPAVGALQAQVARLRAALWGRAAFIGLLHSIGVHMCTIVAVIAYSRALDLPITALDALAVVPVTIFAAALPISLSGWGVREGAFVAGFALYGVGSAEAMILSVMIGLSVTLSSLPGGLLWLSLSGRRTAAPVSSGSL